MAAAIHIVEYTKFPNSIQIFQNITNIKFRILPLNLDSIPQTPKVQNACTSRHSFRAVSTIRCLDDVTIRDVRTILAVDEDDSDDFSDCDTDDPDDLYFDDFCPDDLYPDDLNFNDLDLNFNLKDFKCKPSLNPNTPFKYLN